MNQTYCELAYQGIKTIWNKDLYDNIDIDENGVQDEDDKEMTKVSENNKEEFIIKETPIEQGLIWEF